MSEVKSWRCRHGFHNWGIWTRPIMVRWCGRCGKRDPEGETGMEAILRVMRK